MEKAATNRAYFIAITGGALLWIAAAVIGNRTEAWDSPLYWSVSYPLCILLAGVLGYRFPAPGAPRSP